MFEKLRFILNKKPIIYSLKLLSIMFFILSGLTFWAYIFNWSKYLNYSKINIFEPLIFMPFILFLIIKFLLNFIEQKFPQKRKANFLYWIILISNIIFSLFIGIFLAHNFISLILFPVLFFLILYNFQKQIYFYLYLIIIPAIWYFIFINFAAIYIFLVC